MWGSWDKLTMQSPAESTAIVAILAEISLRSPPKIFIFIIKECIFRIKVSKKLSNLILEKSSLSTLCNPGHWPWSSCRSCMSVNSLVLVKFVAYAANFCAASIKPASPIPSMVTIATTISAVTIWPRTKSKKFWLQRKLSQTGKKKDNSVI